MILAPDSLPDATAAVVAPCPKQAKFLGATVAGVGVITTVSAEAFDCFALIEDDSGREHHCFTADLRRDQLTFPVEPQPYRETRRRIGYGLWADVLELKGRLQSDLTHELYRA